MPAYTIFISGVHKSYRVEKIVLHHLIFLLIKISKQGPRKIDYWGGTYSYIRVVHH